MSQRLAVLCSGGGSNLLAILHDLSANAAEHVAEVALVASDRESAGALQHGRNHSIPSVPMDAQLRTEGLLPLLRQYQIDCVVLAGYLRHVPDDVTAAYRGRIVNVHPSLLPAFGGQGMYGAKVHTAVLAAGVRITGATVHFVDPVYDHGPIIAQWPVPVFPSDSVDRLARRVLEVEHAMYPAAVRAVARGQVTLGPDGRVQVTGLHPAAAHFATAVGPGAAVAALQLAASDA